MWENKPKYKSDKIIIHQIEYTCESPLDKYKRVRKTIPEQTFNENVNVALLINRLDDIACKIFFKLGLTNLGGNDIDYNPLFFSYGILYFDGENEKFHLFSNKEKFENDDVKKHLSEYQISLFDYCDLYKVLASTNNELSNYLLIVDKESCNQNIFSIINDNPSLKTRFIENGYVEYTKVVFIIKSVHQK